MKLCVLATSLVLGGAQLMGMGAFGQGQGQGWGQCPPTDGMMGICVVMPDACYSDSQCGPGQKCCPDGCGRKCKPVGGPPQPKPPAYPPQPKPPAFGQCPATDGKVGICVVMPDACYSDSQCGPGQKCCPDGCGSRCKPVGGLPTIPNPIPKPPGGGHSGQCPPTDGLFGPCVVGPNSCLSDAECAPSEKCCSRGCGRVCTPVAQVQRPPFTSPIYTPPYFPPPFNTPVSPFGPSFSPPLSVSPSFNIPWSSYSPGPISTPYFPPFQG